MKKTTPSQGIGVGATVIVLWDKLKAGIDYLADIGWQINQIDWSLAMPWLQEILALIGAVFAVIWGFDKTRNVVSKEVPVPAVVPEPMTRPPVVAPVNDTLIDQLPIYPPRNDFSLSLRSLENLHNVHPDLKKLVRVALQASQYDFTVYEGIRTIERQKQMVAEGKSTTMNSRHLYGLAIDLMAYDENGKGTWDMKYYAAIADAFAEASRITGIPVEWGGMWQSFPDGPHFQLPFGQYPNSVGTVTPIQA